MIRRGGTSYDAVVVGAGPNGLAAAIELAREGLSVLLLEARSTPGGGARSAELTLPDFVHDVCSAVHPLGAASPFFASLPLERLGVEWVHPEVPLAHPLDDGTAAVLHTSLGDTAAGLGEDGAAYRRLLGPLLEGVEELLPEILQPLRLPRHPIRLARFGLEALRSSDSLVRRRFRGEAARALFGGCAAHSVVPLHFRGSAAFGLILLLSGHAFDWPFVRGGSQRLVDALVRHFEELGGELQTDRTVRGMDDIPRSRAVLFDLTPLQVLEIAGGHLPLRYRNHLARFRYGPGVFKLDWALDGPIPWRAEACRRAGTVHVGGSYLEIAESEAASWSGRHPERPFVLVAQSSLADDTRAPTRRHTGWAYCHVPHGSDEDMTEVIERQVERFAPGFRDLVLARHTRTSRELEAYNANMIGGDIGGGANTLRQVLARPAPRFDPYTTPNRRLFLCSSSTPPGGGVHGMCGSNAARSALRRVFGRKRRPLPKRSE